MKIWFALLIVCLCGIACEGQDINFNFYNQKVTIPELSSRIKSKVPSNDRGLKEVYSLLEEDPAIIDTLIALRKRFRLNDWLYYRLIRNFSETITGNENAIYLTWFFLGKSGYCTQILFSRRRPLLFIKSNEQVAGLYRYNESYCLNCEKGLIHATKPKFQPFKRKRRAFSFLFDPLPVFPDKTLVNKIFHLSSPREVSRDIELTFNKELIDCLNDYPNFNMKHTFSVPLSEQAYQVVTELRNAFELMSDSLKTVMTMKFVVSNSHYKSDQDAFGRERWMTPEELLFYGAGDCEDLSSFTYYLLKEVVKRNLLIIDYPHVNHINVAINLDLGIAPDLYYKGRPYYVCETSTIFKPLPLGNNEMIRDEKWEIIGEYIKQ